jgi:hypothetical protein
MHSKVFVKLKKTLKPSVRAKKPKKTQKNPKNPKKTKKNPKKPTGLGFFKKNRVFSNPEPRSFLVLTALLLISRTKLDVEYPLSFLIPDRDTRLFTERTAKISCYRCIFLVIISSFEKVGYVCTALGFSHFICAGSGHTASLKKYCRIHIKNECVKREVVRRFLLN